MSMLTLGIDPGLTGAVALLDADGQPELIADLAVIRDGRLSWIDGGSLQSTLLDALRGRACRAVVERVSAMPGQGVALLLRVRSGPRQHPGDSADTAAANRTRDACHMEARTRTRKRQASEHRQSAAAVPRRRSHPREASWARRGAAHRPLRTEPAPGSSDRKIESVPQGCIDTLFPSCFNSHQEIYSTAMSIQTLSPAQRLAFSPGELATLTGLSISTVHRRLASGEIRFGRSGRRVLIPREELDRLLRPEGAAA